MMNQPTHRIEMGLVQVGPYTNPHLECVTCTGWCAFNEYVAEEGHTEALFGIGWPASHAGSDDPLRFPIHVVEVRDPDRPDQPTWDFQAVAPPRLITVEQLDAVPIGTIIRSGSSAWIDDTYGPWVAEKVGEDLWALTGLGSLKQNTVLADAVHGWDILRQVDRG